MGENLQQLALFLGQTIIISMTGVMAPGPITDLAAESPTSGSVTLRWTAPGDDLDSGTASRYEIRYDKERPGDQRHMRADITRANELLGWVPAVDFSEGMARTVRWARATGQR